MNYLEEGYVKWQYDHDKKRREEIEAVKKQKDKSLIVPILFGTITGVANGLILNGLTKLIVGAKRES